MEVGRYSDIAFFSSLKKLLTEKMEKSSFKWTMMLCNSPNSLTPRTSKNEL